MLSNPKAGNLFQAKPVCKVIGGEMLAWCIAIKRNVCKERECGSG